MDTLPSFIRTLIPIVVAQVVAYAAKAGFDIDPSYVAYGVGLVIAAGYYAGVRYLETNVSPKFGWLLGLVGAPSYGSATDVAEDAAADYVATTGDSETADESTETTETDAASAEAVADPQTDDAPSDPAGTDTPAA